MTKNDTQKSLMVVHKGRLVDAIYRKPEIGTYEGNPLIEAMPPVLTPEQAMTRLAFYPNYDKSYRQAPPVGRALRRTFDQVVRAERAA